MNIINSVTLIYGLISGYYGNYSATMNWNCSFNNVVINDYYYNGVLNDLVIGADVFGDFVYDDSSDANLSSSAENEFEISLHLESGEPNTFEALAMRLQQISLERYGTNEYAISCFDTIEFYCDLGDIIVSDFGFVDFNLSLYLDIGINEDYYSFSFVDLITLHFEIDNSSYMQNLSDFFRSYELGMTYYDNFYSSVVITNNGEYYYELVEYNKDHWEEQGRINGYEQGYQEGINSTSTGVLELITKPFVEMGQFLNISIAPNLTLGMIISVPIVVAIIGFLIKALIA